MAVGWFIAKLTVTINYPNWPYANRETPIDENALVANGGRFIRVELTNRLIYKIVAPNAVLSAVAALANVKRLPTSLLDDPLSSLTTTQQNAIIAELEDQGYTLQQITTQFPNIGQATLRQVLKFMARNRTLPVFDSVNLVLAASSDPNDVVACSPDIDTMDTTIT